MSFIKARKETMVTTRKKMLQSILIKFFVTKGKNIVKSYKLKKDYSQKFGLT